MQNGIDWHHSGQLDLGGLLALSAEHVATHATSARHTVAG